MGEQNVHFTQDENFKGGDIRWAEYYHLYQQLWA